MVSTLRQRPPIDTNKDGSGITPYYQALNSYLDDMLQRATEPVAKTSPTQSQPVDLQAFFDTALTDSVEVPADLVRAPVTIEFLEQDDIGETDPDPTAPAAHTPEPEAEPLKYPGDCLRFDIDGIAYAMPLLDVQCIIPFCHRINVIPGQPKWCKGSVVMESEKRRVVDFSYISGVRQNTDALSAEEDEPHLLLLHQHDLALLVDQLGEVVSIDKEEVQWASSESSKQWRSGVIKQLLTTLLSAEGVATTLGYPPTPAVKGGEDEAILPQHSQVLAIAADIRKRLA